MSERRRDETDHVCPIENRAVDVAVLAASASWHDTTERTERGSMRPITFHRQAKLAALTVAGLAVTLSVYGTAQATGSTEPRVEFGSYGYHGPPAPFDADIRNNTMAVSPDESRAVVANSESGRVRIVDLHGDRPATEIGGYVTPRNVLFAPDGNSFYLSDSSRGVVDQFSLSGNRVISRMPLGAGAFGTAMTNDGERLYVNNQASGTVTVVDLPRRQPVAVLDGFDQPRQGIKLSPDNDLLYVTNYQSDRITKIDRASKEVLAQIAGFDQIRGLSISKDGSRLYGANSGDDTISIVDTETGETVQRVPVGDEPYGAALSPDESVLLTGDLASDTVTAVDPSTGEVKGVITGTKGPRQAISFSKDSRTAWVLNEDLTVAEIDVRSMKVTRTLGSQPGIANRR